MQQTKREEVLWHARDHLGVKFRHQGRQRLGVDCIGLILRVGTLIGCDMPSVTGYRRQPRPDVFLGMYHEHMVHKTFPDRKPGDVVLLRDQIFTTHCAIYDIVDGREMIIHSFAPRKMVVEEPFSDLYIGSTTWCFAYPGVDD
jgi:cell wall-associated NlpC family hydrolase